MSTAILIHGCHLQAKEWEHIIWGRPQEGILGRVPRGIQLAIFDHIPLIFWGTGASEKDGVKEAQYTFDYAVAHGPELPEFIGWDRYEVEGFLRSVSHIDIDTQNTLEEIKRAGEVCRERGITRMILVSSPTHISRCLLEAEKLRSVGKLQGVEVFATASDTCYADSTPGNVLIVEPPHRGDRPDVPIHKTLKRAMRLGRGEQAQMFNTELGAYLDTWENQGL